jgi:phosphoribosylformylglycinamidine synthase
MWVSPPDLSSLILKHYNEDFALPKISEGAQASIIGKITQDGLYKVSYYKQILIDAKAEDICKGIVYNRPTMEPKRDYKEPNLGEIDYRETLLKLLSHPNIASAKPIYENYDKQVQGRTIIERGEADAGVMQAFNSLDFPEEIRSTGIALSLAANPRFGLIDPYFASANAVIEAMMNIAAVGATPEAITDCLCFGNPEKPEQMWEIVESIKGIKAACENIHLKDYREAATPIIAGNVSLYNESKNGPIPPSPMIACVGKLTDVNCAINVDFKQTDSLIVLVGQRKNEFGGSLFYALHNEFGANVPKPDFKQVQNQIFAVTDVINKRLALAAKTINRGGFAVALARMCFGSFIGAEAKMDSRLLFSETPGFILEVSQLNFQQVEEIFKKYQVDIEVIGMTTKKGIIEINDFGINVEEAHHKWENSLKN